MSTFKLSILYFLILLISFSCKKSDEKLIRNHSEKIIGSWKLVDYVYNDNPTDLTNQVQITSFYPLKNEVVLKRTYDDFTNILTGVYSIGIRENGNTFISIYYPGTGLSTEADIIAIKRKKMIWQATAGSDVLELTFEKME